MELSMPGNKIKHIDLALFMPGRNIKHLDG
jgi:hypothetical protein